MTFWNSWKRSQNSIAGQKKKKRNVKNTNKPRNWLTQTHDCKMLLMEFQWWKGCLSTGEATKGEADAFMYIYSSFIHSLTGQIFIEQLLYNLTSYFYYSKRDFRRLFAFLVSRSTLKSVSPLPLVFLVYVVKSVNISFTFYLLLSFDNLEAELKPSLLILATNNFWILFISRILDLFKKKKIFWSQDLPLT